MYQAIIVDDEQMIINSLMLGFDWESHGYEIIATCTDSSEALEMIRFIRPDVVFTDIKMPVLSGLELMAQIHQEFPQIQFVFISGYADFDYAKKALQLGASGYCLKPLENEEIESVLSVVTDRLEKRQTVITSAFNLLMHHPTTDSADRLLHILYSEEKLPDNLCIVLALGKADFLFTRQVSYDSIKVAENCYLYFVSSNAEYLSYDIFYTTLLRAVSEKQIRAMAWTFSTNPAEALANHLKDLFDAVYSYFVGKPIALGPLDTDTTVSNEAVLKHISNLANNRRIKDISDELKNLKDSYPNLKPSEAVTLYNVCFSLINRIKTIKFTTGVRYPHELASRYDTIDNMLQHIQQNIDELTGSADPTMVNNESFKKILEYINQNFTEVLSFQQIAADYSINPSYLSQLFKKELGLTFTSYLTNLRVQYAKELLSTTTLRISEIPEKIGYRYDYNFAKLFKKETGYTPKEYRKLHLKL